MNEVKIDKSKLIEIVKKNRDEHRDIFLKAQEKYREVAIALLDSKLKAMREGQPFVLQELVSLVQPVDHTADYDRALSMLELEVRDVVTLLEDDFSNLVQDEWGWSRGWALSNSHYTSSPKFNKFQ